jgi:glycosyltransferase involved in cell wall biosynthesis
MNVLHYIDNLRREGAQVMVGNLVTAADKSQINYSVCVRQPGDSLAAELGEQGIDVAGPSQYFGFRSMRQSVSFLKQICIENQIHVIHAHMADAAFLGWLVARKLGLPLVISHHGHEILECNPVCRFVYFVLLNLAVRYAEVNIAVSPAVAERVRKLYNLKEQSVQVIGNGVRIPDGSQLKSKQGRKENRNSSPTLISVGRLVPLKGQRQLIYAVAKLVSYFPDIRLYIVGGGELVQELKQLAESNGVSRCIVLTGAVENVAAYLSQADIYVSSSRIEGMPVSVLEAMAWQLPVVASDIPGNKTVVSQGETGFLYELDNIDDLVEKIVEVVKNPEFSTSVAIRARSMVAQKYSAAASEEKHAQLYQRILGQARPRFHHGK